MKREDVEAMVEFCESGHPAMVDAPIRLTRREAAALGRAWLALDGAATGRVDMLCAGDAIVVDEIDNPLPLNKQRVRIVPTPNTTEGE